MDETAVRATLKETVIHWIHELAAHFQAVGDPEKDAHLRAWSILRREFPFSRLDDLCTGQYRQAISFLEELAGRTREHQQVPDIYRSEYRDRTGAAGG